MVWLQEASKKNHFNMRHPVISVLEIGLQCLHLHSFFRFIASSRHLLCTHTEQGTNDIKMSTKLNYYPCGILQKYSKTNHTLEELRDFTIPLFME